MRQYNSILWRTHDKKNSLLIHLRNHHFDVARHWHDVMNICAVIPIFLLIVMYGIYYALDIQEISVADLRSVSVAISMFFTFLTALISIKVGKEKQLSDRYRELFDCRVFELEQDRFMVDLKDVDVGKDELERRCFDLRLPRPAAKYSVWCEEVFSDNRASNVISCEVQNIAFSRDVYQFMERTYRKTFVASIAVTIAICIIFAAIEDIFATVPIVAAVAPKLFLLFKTIQKSHKIWTNHQQVMDILVEEKERFINADDSQLRMIQNHMFRGRADDIFIPRRIYLAYVRTMHDHSGYWYEFTKLYHEGLDMKSPSSADEIMVAGRDYDSDSMTDYTMLSEIQGIVHSMMKEIHRVFSEADPPIRYFVDGGSLLDICRPEHPVFWDDDMDICVHHEDLARAKDLLKENLPECCAIQDESDPYFIPYACKFRVRDRGSVTEEMDNSIYPYFGKGLRGAFIDVYGVIPPLTDRKKEERFRSSMKKSYVTLKNLEKEIYRDTVPASYDGEIPKDRTDRLDRNLDRYLREKERFLGIERDYIAEKDRDGKLMGYLPSYSCENHDLPYYTTEDVFPERPRTVEWNGITLNVPNNPERIIEAFYGPDWREPRTEYKTSLKHIYTFDKVRD